jgi:hypothetical protein
MRRLHEDRMLVLALNICFKGWVVANHKSSNYPASNGNPYKLLMRNLLNSFKRE